jgi:predicted nucleic acid-binding protein
MVLPDTSVWVEYLRADPPAPEGTEGAAGEEQDAGADASTVDATDPSPLDELDSLIEAEQVLTCGPVVAELMAGARGENASSSPAISRHSPGSS